MKTVLLIILLIFYVPAAAGAGLSNNIQINSDTLKIDSKGRTASFSGHVKADLGSLVFTCRKMVVTYDDTGSILKLSASGLVTVKKDGAAASSDRAVYFAGSRMLVLSGSPVLKKGGNTLKGSKIEVNIDTGLINIINAAGTFRFDKTRIKNETSTP